jgi:predicted nucleotide-binding protein (sugar kinase/HSP70/actin superfamily)
MDQQQTIDNLESNLEAQLAAFEAEERERLGLKAEKDDHWFDKVPSTFTRKQRAHTTILVCGLTMAHDHFIQAALNGIGYKVAPMDVPSNEALQYGREFGNRGQCNPTYFTVGNLIKHLHELEAGGMSKEEIVKNHIFLTAGACGPCRFGTYVTEYRKALRDSGFEGFRVMLFQQTGGLKQATGEEIGLELNPIFFWGVIRAIFLGDVLNALMYRIRPFEVEAGATDKAVAESKAIIAKAFADSKSLIKAVYKVRKIMGAVKVDRTRPVPKVGIIGEFWAMTTEGDGNYGMQRFLESEGAEVDIQVVAAWLLYMLWQAQYDTRERANLRGTDTGTKFGLEGVDVRKKLAMLIAVDKGLRVFFKTISHAVGLRGFQLADMDNLADVSHAFYDNNLRGGEGHMEVGKLILNIAKTKVNMTLSIKPFGCMPSSSVSDGVQSMITELYPQGIFLPIETNGDGAVNVYSRVQMQLFKAKQLAKKEIETALTDASMTMDEVQAYLVKHPRLNHAFHRSPHVYGSTAADLIHEVGVLKNAPKGIKGLSARIGKVVVAGKKLVSKKSESNLAIVAKIAAAKAAKPKHHAAVKTDSIDYVDESRPAVPKGRTQLNVLG